jgi:hypothetical protein
MMTTFATVAIWVKSMCSNGDNFKGGVLCIPECFSTQYPCLAAFLLLTGKFKIWKCEIELIFGGFQMSELRKEIIKIVGVLYLVFSV